VSNFKRELYMDNLKESGGAAFQNVSLVSVEPATTTTDVPSGDEDSEPYGTETDTTQGSESSAPIGTIVGVVMVLLVVLILGLACYVRCQGSCQKKRPSEVPVSSKGDTTKGDGKDIPSDRSGTSEESICNKSGKENRSEHSSDGSLFTYIPKPEATPIKSARNAITSSLAYMWNRIDDESSQGSKSLRNTLSFAAIWNRGDEESSQGSTLGSDSNNEEEVVSEEFTVEIPKGKLGLILDTCETGYPIVQQLKPNSPFHGRVQVGDRLHSVDGRDVNMITTETISSVIATKPNTTTRVFVFGRPYKKK